MSGIGPIGANYSPRLERAGTSTQPKDGSTPPQGGSSTQPKSPAPPVDLFEDQSDFCKKRPSDCTIQPPKGLDSRGCPKGTDPKDQCA